MPAAFFAAKISFSKNVASCASPVVAPASASGDGRAEELSPSGLSQNAYGVMLHKMLFALENLYLDRFSSPVGDRLLEKIRAALEWTRNSCPIGKPI